MGGEGYPEPVDVTGELMVISFARPEAQALVELGGLVEILDRVGQAGNAADLHGALLVGVWDCWIDALLNARTRAARAALAAWSTHSRSTPAVTRHPGWL